MATIKDWLWIAVFFAVIVGFGLAFSAVTSPVVDSIVSPATQERLTYGILPSLIVYYVLSRRISYLETRLDQLEKVDRRF